MIWCEEFKWASIVSLCGQELSQSYLKWNKITDGEVGGKEGKRAKTCGRAAEGKGNRSGTRPGELQSAVTQHALCLQGLLYTHTYTCASSPLTHSYPCGPPVTIVTHWLTPASALSCRTWIDPPPGPEWRGGVNLSIYSRPSGSFSSDNMR